MIILSGKLNRIGYQKLKQAGCITNETSLSQWNNSLTNLTSLYGILKVPNLCISQVGSNCNTSIKFYALDYEIDS